MAGPTGADTAATAPQRLPQGSASNRRAADDALVVRGNYTPAGGADATRRLLEGGEPPTAVFVSNVTSAIGVLDTLHSQGLAVPDDLLLATTPSQPVEEIVREPTELVVRESTGPAT